MKTFFFARFSIVTIAATAAFIMRAPYLSHSLGFDETVWTYIAHETVKGGFMPYRDVFDNKPPLQYLPFILAELWHSDGQIEVRLVGLLLSVISVAATATVLHRLLGPLPALVAALLQAVFGGSPMLEGQYLLASENLIQLPLLAVFLFLCLSCRQPRSIPGDSLLYGWTGSVLTGMAVAVPGLVKQTYILLIPLSAAIVALRFRNARVNALLRAGHIVAGSGVVWLAIVIPFGLANALPQFAYSIFIFNLRYHVGMPTISQALFTSGVILFSQCLVVIFGILVGIHALIRRETRWPTALLWCFLLLGVLSVLAGGSRLYRHYYMLVTFPLYCLAGVGLQSLAPGTKRIAVIVIVTLLAVAAPVEFHRTLQASSTQEMIEPDAALTNYLSSRLLPSDTIYLGPLSFQHYLPLGKRAPVPWITGDVLSAEPDAKKRLISVLRAAKTAWIVTDTDPVWQDEEFVSLLRDAYTLEAVFGDRQLYRLRASLTNYGLSGRACGDTHPR